MSSSVYASDPHKWRDAWERARRTLGVGLILAGLEGALTFASTQLTSVEWTQAYWAAFGAAVVNAFLAGVGSYLLRAWRKPQVPNKAPAQ